MRDCSGTLSWFSGGNRRFVVAQCSLPARAELHSRPHRMALLPGTRPLGAGGAPVALLSYSSRPQRPAAPRAALRSHALQPGCAAGTLCGVTLPKVSCPCVHTQRSELPAVQDVARFGGGRCERNRWPRRPGRAAAAPHGGGSAARGRLCAQRQTSMTRLACLGMRTKRPSSPRTGADCLSGQHAVACSYWCVGQSAVRRGLPCAAGRRRANSIRMSIRSPALRRRSSASPTPTRCCPMTRSAPSMIGAPAGDHSTASTADGCYA